MNENLTNSVAEFFKNEKKVVEEIKRIYRIVDPADKNEIYYFRNFLESLKQDYMIRENFLENMLKQVRLGIFPEKGAPPYKQNDVY